MKRAENIRPCSACSREAQLDFTFAFQPIIDTQSNQVFSYEALVRGPEGQGAAWVLSQVTDSQRHAFDQQSRNAALTLASALRLGPRININFMPDAVYEPERCVTSTLKVAHELGIPVSSIVFEVTEEYTVDDRQKLVTIFEAYRRIGLKTAIDDFGAGYSGLALLSEFQPDFVKLDMALIRGIEKNTIKQTIVRAVTTMCESLGSTIIAEGVETNDEAQWLIDSGVTLLQGYFFGRPKIWTEPATA